MYSKTLICVQRLCRIEIIPDYTGSTVFGNYSVNKYKINKYVYKQKVN